jgi:hypothetical protein
LNDTFSLDPTNKAEKLTFQHPNQHLWLLQMLKSEGHFYKQTFNKVWVYLLKVIDESRFFVLSFLKEKEEREANWSVRIIK